MMTTTNEMNKRHGRLWAACALTTLGVATALSVVLCPPANAAPKQKATSTTKATKKAPAAAPFPLYALDVGNTRLAYTVTLNGFPIDDSPGDANGHFSSTRVGEYIADGDNVVAIHLSAPAPTAKFFSSFSVIIRVTGNPQFFGYEWDASVPHPHPPLPFTAEKHFTTHLQHPWEWQSAPKITLDAPTKQAINAHMKRLFDALNTKNVDEAVALFALRNHDHYLGRGLPIEDVEKDSREGWVELFAIPGWRMYPIDYPHLRYDLIAGGRVVQVLRSDEGSPLITAMAAPDGQNKGFDIYMCQVHGQWTLIR